MLYIVGVGTPILPKEVTMFPCTSWVWAQPYFKEGTLHAICRGFEHELTCTIKAETLSGVCCGCGSTIPFQEVESLSYTLYIVDVAVATSHFAKCQYNNFFCVHVSLLIKCQSVLSESLVQCCKQGRPMSDSSGY